MKGIKFLLEKFQKSPHIKQGKHVILIFLKLVIPAFLFAKKIFSAIVVFMTTKAVKSIKWSPVDMEARKKLDFKAGDTVRVWNKIVDEKGKSRLQAFEGIVLARKHGTEAGATFTVRKVTLGVGVERIFPLYSPMIDKIEITKKAQARRSKLYYIRTKAVRDVRKKLRATTLEQVDEKEEVSAETSE